MPSRLYFDERCVEVAENIDRWWGSDYCYFKVRGDDGNLYILRVDDNRNEWDMTLFQREGPLDLQLPEKGHDPHSSV